MLFFRLNGQDRILFYPLRGIKATTTPMKTFASASAFGDNNAEPSRFLARQAVLRNKKLDIRQEFLKV